MQVKSVYKYVRMSAQKAREVTRAITGMPVSQALSVLDFTPKKAAFLIGKTLRSALANAENNHQMDTENLIVESAVATDGPALKRIMPRARGSASPIKKRMCHITVIVAPKEVEPAKEEASAETKTPAKKAAKRAPAKKAARSEKPKKAAAKKTEE